MACKVSVKDIESKIRNEVIDKFGSSAKPTNGGKAVFIAKDISTKSIGPTLQLLEIKLNNEYGAKYFGPVISYSNEVYGYEVSIHPSQELADGMTAQNQRDEMFEEVGQEDIQYAQDPYESEILEAQGYEYIGNRDTEMGNIPAYRKPNQNYSARENALDFRMKALDILSSPQAIKSFEKGERNKWSLDKILTELQIPKNQKQLILDKNVTNREEIITSLLADNSFVVEINTSKNRIASERNFNNDFDIPSSEEEMNQMMEGTSQDNTQYYSNLTVPGGTNYTENEIATPGIKPSIKGHAQFSTDNGIGWFRSDDKTGGLEHTYTKEELEDFLPERFNVGEEQIRYVPSENKWYSDTTRKFLSDEQVTSKYLQTLPQKEATKTRRILEVQSDLFQKGRDREDLTVPEISDKELIDLEGIAREEEWTTEQYNKEINDYKEKLALLKNPKANQFLQLLNKNNNWVNFFIKSIIQDSAKKGYKKVLFPSGNTLVKIESANRYNDINSAKKANETNLVNTALFYENTVTNTLNKIYSKENVKQVTDEYGNKWNEVTIREEDKSNFNFSSREQKQNQENNSSRNNAQKQNAKRPITDNYVEYKRYKETKLEKSNRILTSLHRDKRNPKKDSKTVMADIARYAKIQADLKHDIDFLDKHEPDLLFQGIQQDIDKLNDALDNATNIETIKEDLDFLYKLVKGQTIDNSMLSGIEPISGFKHSGFDKVSAAVDALGIKYKERLTALTQELINKDITYATNVLGNDAITPQQLEEMFNSQSDITWLEKTFLGITSSSTNDTILGQVLKSFLETKKILRNSEVKRYQDKLQVLMKKLDKKGFDFIFEKDSGGIETGNIINLISPKFNSKLAEYFGISKNEKLTNEAKYLKKIQWLKANTEVINPMQLSAVYEVYKDIYPEYFADYTQEKADKYEKFLRDRLGPLYEEEIEKQLHTLENFQLQKESIEAAGESTAIRNVLRINPWEFIKHYNSPKRGQELEYSLGSGVDRVFSDIQNIRFIPVKEVFVAHNELGDEVFADSGYYNKDFQELAKDTDKLEYWKLMKEIYTEYINPTYNNSSFSYAKFEDEWAEAIHKAKGLHKGTEAFKQAVSGYKAFFYERGNYKENDSDRMSQNYHDTSTAEIKQLSEALKQLPSEALLEEAKKEGINTVRKDHDTIAKNVARKKVLTKYSTDINKVTGALLQMTALQKAREDTLPIANVILDAHKLASKNDKGVDVRKRSVERMEGFIDRVIRGENEKYRGSSSFLGTNLIEDTMLGKILDKFSKIPFIGRYVNKKKAMFLTSSEKELVKYLEQLKEAGHNENNESQITLDGITYVLRIDKKTKKSRYLVNREGTLLEITTKEAYEKAFQEHLTEKIKEIGLDISAAGIIQGMLKTIILKGLALNPISGIFNRVEGKNSGLIMDQTGEFWKAGNIHQANNFMMFANFLKFTPDRFTPEQSKKIKELEKLKILIQNMDLIQDRKNELERQSDKSKFNYGDFTDLYQFAVGNPEFKNQGAILLSVLMDTKIKDSAGNEVAIFNGSEFPAHDNINGKLVLKPEFRTGRDGESNITNWEDFSINEIDITDNQYFITNRKIKEAISKSQGNYDSLDVIHATSHIFGRSLTLFMKWMPEHFMQRFSKGQGFDTTTGKQKLVGRYMYLWRNNPALFTSGILSLFVLYGLNPVSALAGLGFTGLVAAKYFKNLYNKDTINNETNNAIDFIGFAKSVVISTLNYPLEMFNSNKLISQDIGNKYIPSMSTTNMSEKELLNLQAVAKELGIKLTFIAFMLLAKRLTWDDDDDKDSDKRQLHNFLDNQLSRMISSLTNWQDPGALVTDLQRLAFLKYLLSIQKTLGSILTMDEKGKLSKNLFDVSPLPRILGRATLPWHDEREYENQQWQDRAVKNWTSGGEWEIGKRYEKLRRDKRQEFREEYQDLGLERDALEDAIDEAMKREFPKRKSGESASSIMERIESGEKGKVSKKKKE